MKTTMIKKQEISLYYLHDSRITSMKADGHKLTLEFADGYSCVEAPYHIKGGIDITGVNWRFCRIYMLDYKDKDRGRYGSFSGEKLSLQEFIEREELFYLEIMDETYAMNRCFMNGFYCAKDRFCEFFMEIHYDGDFKYIIEQ